MAVAKLGLYKLLAPQFLVGFRFPDYVDQYLSLLAVDDLHTAFDEKACVFSGVASFPTNAPRGHGLFTWDDVTIGFRLTIPRDGAQDIKTGAQALPGVANLLAAFGDVPGTTIPTEYPGFAFRLELLFTAITLNLPDKWKPAMLDDIAGLLPDPNPLLANKPVKFVLPKVGFLYEQGQDPSKTPLFKVTSWGSSGFDAPSDLAEGELVHMEPALAIHESGRFGFGVDQVILDLSRDHTPPEILSNFGVGDDFEGLYFKEIRVFYADKSKDFALSADVVGALISFSGEVSLEASVDYSGLGTAFHVSVRLFEGAREINYTRGVVTATTNVWTGGKAAISQAGVIRVLVTGGVPDYTVSVKLNGVELWDKVKQQAALTSVAPIINGTLKITVTDAAPDPKKDFSQQLAFTVAPAPVAVANPDGGPLDQAVVLPLPAHPPPPPPPHGKKPRAIRKLGMRIRLERSVPVLLEVNGELDFQTPLEKTLNANSGDLALKQQPGASADPNTTDGVVDFVINVTYDTSTHVLTETLTLGAAPSDRDGLLELKNDPAVRIKNILGALLVFFPVLNQLTKSFDASKSGDWAILAVDLGIPMAIGATGKFILRRATLYGGELKARQSIPPGEAVKWTDTSVTFDYGVEFDLNIDLNNAVFISTAKPVSVRYQAAGFNLHFDNGVSYQPVFDTSKGYEINMGDPGNVQVSGPLGKIFKILSCRVTQFNPLVLDVDLGSAVNLGPITFENVKIKWPIKPLGDPTISFGGVKVDLKGTVVGSGSLIILPNGFSGSLDLSIKKINLRLAATLRVEHIKDDPGTLRELTAVLATVVVEFPTPITLGASGMGLFGFSGLFAMHYKRDEPPRQAGSAISPALQWLANAGGDPTSPKAAWVTAPDRWSFGLGIVLGSLDGGTLANFRGMFVLELPLRILIFIKMTLISKLPKLSDANLVTGVLGVIDLDFYRGQITIGVIVDAGIANLLSIKLAAEIFFNLHQKTDWHLYLGTTTQPATVTFLTTVRAYGYLMISGSRINNFPPPSGPGLPGTAIALGVSVTMVLGNTSIGLYLRVSCSIDIGVSFNPMYLAGELRIDGEFRLFVVSLEVHASLSVVASNPSRIEGSVCGKVHFFFFKVEGCVNIKIGQPAPRPPAPPLVTGVWLQSRAPVITAGQGGDRPIDGSLGNATLAATAHDPKSDVPIDTIPVIQFYASPLIGGVNTKFTLATPPGLTPDGWVYAGPDVRMRYQLKSITLAWINDSNVQKTLTVSTPATWRLDRTPGPQGGNTNIDLALFSRVPFTAERAFERSGNLHSLVSDRWHNVCRPIAPAVCVMYTFCGEQIGPSGHGWKLRGTPPPDPPGSLRSGPPPLDLFVDEMPVPTASILLGIQAGMQPGAALEPARVLGLNRLPATPPPAPDKRMEGFHADGSSVGFGVPSVADPGLAMLTLSTPTTPGITRVVLNTPGALLMDIYIADARVDFTSMAADGPNPWVVGDVTYQNIGPNTNARGTIGNFKGVVIGARMEMQLAKPITAITAKIALAPVPAIAVPAAPGFAASLTPGTPALAAQFVATLAEALPIGPVPASAPPAAASSRRSRLLAEYAERRDRLAKQLFQFVTKDAGFDTGVAIGNTTVPPGPDLRCMRALKLPVGPAGRTDAAGQVTPVGQVSPAQVSPVQVSPVQVSPVGQVPPGGQPSPNGPIQVDSTLWTSFRTGPAVSVTFFLAVSPDLMVPAASRIFFQEFDAKGKLLQQSGIVSPQLVTDQTTGLPAAWLDSSRPWSNDIVSVAAFVAQPQFQALRRMVVTLKTNPATDSIRIIASGANPAAAPSTVLVGAVQVCPLSEQNRAAQGKDIQNGEIQTLAGYLGSGENAGLLERNSKYTLTVNYDTTQPDGTTGNSSQTFFFNTDANPPARLDPYVLGTTPDADEHYHFYNDPIRIIFNEPFVADLYKAYGSDLKAVLHAADGVAPLPHPDDIMTPMPTQPADLGSPFRDSLETMVLGEAPPCLKAIADAPAGALTNGVYSAPFVLSPLMNYTLDVELSPPPAAIPATPLFRRTFTTSKFARLEDLIAELATKPIRYRALTSQLALPSLNPVEVLTDQEIQAILMNAGEQALPAPKQSGIVVYCAKRPNETTYSPHCILIDFTERIWRFRAEPRLEVVADGSQPADPDYKRVVPQNVPALELMETAGNVARFIRSSGGARTLAPISGKFNPPAGGAPIQINARRLKSELYGLGELIVPLPPILLTPRAPWEDDHE